MQNFDYCNPTKIIFGKGTIGRIGSEIKAFGPKKVLLIAGGGSIKANGVYNQIVRSLQEAGIEWVEAWGVQANPVLSKVREIIAQAASLALSGFQNAGVCFGDFASHGIEHGISAINPKIAHGAGLGVVLPAWIAYCHHVKPDLFRRWAKNVWNADSAEEGLKAFREKIHSWRNPVTLRELGVLEEQIPAIAANAVEFGLTGMVKVLSDEDIRAILRLA